MTRIFAIRNRNGDLVLDARGEPVCFRHKKLAKVFRDREVTNWYMVTRGPDHWRGLSKVNNDTYS